MDTGVDFCQDSPPVRVYSNKNHYDLELAISNLALLIPCLEFENFLAQIPSFEVF